MAARTSGDSVRTIPVVVHIIHDGGSENISDAQVESQIRVLNEDFRKKAGTNGDGNGVDTDVKFCLANLSPDGNCTNGIVRIQSPLTDHQSYQRSLLKELSFWDNARYLNIYVVKDINGNVGGYSSFPGGPPDEDGVVVRHNLFGTMGTASGLGRTSTHELGHWMGLYHTFNNGCGNDLCTDGDYVCDTPPVREPNRSCPINANSCTNDQPDMNDQVRNYMDYTSDACQNMLTYGQYLRIQASLDTFRTEIWTSANLIATGCDSNYVPPVTCPVVADFVTLNREICTENSAYFIDKSLNDAIAWQWTFDGGMPAKSFDQNPTVTYDTPGTYDVLLVVSDGVIIDSLLFEDYITVSPPKIGDPLSFQENLDSGLYPPSTLTINNFDQGVTWELDTLASVSGKYSIKINNLINTNYGSSDELVLPYFDLTTGHPDSNVFLNFTWAYAKSDPTFSDELLVLLSTDCGASFSRVFYGTQNTLATGPTQATPFIPDATQWRDANISLDAYRDEAYVQLKFVNVTDGGNNLYLDNIYVGDGSFATTAISGSSSLLNGLTLFPNPSQESSTLEYTLERSSVLELEIYNLQGQLIKSYPMGIQQQGTSRFPISTMDMGAGVYFVKMKTTGMDKMVKMTVIK